MARRSKWFLNFGENKSAATSTLHFCPLEAEAIGLSEAIVVARLRFWLARSKHCFGGQAVGLQHLPRLAEAVPVLEHVHHQRHLPPRIG